MQRKQLITNTLLTLHKNAIRALYQGTFDDVELYTDCTYDLVITNEHFSVRCFIAKKTTTTTHF